MVSWALAPMPMLCITKVSSILLHTNQPGKEDRKDSHHKLSALLSLIFGRSSSWCCMTNKANASSIFLECHRIKKSQHPPCVHALMLSWSLAPMPMLCITKVSSILLHANQPGKEDRKDSHHKLSALLSLIFGRSSSWGSMTKKAPASSIQLECHRIKKSHINHAFMLSCSLALLPQCHCSASKTYQAYCCIQISREKKTEKILITSFQLCWAWYLEDHPLDAAWQIRRLLLAYS